LPYDLLSFEGNNYEHYWKKLDFVDCLISV